MLSPKLLQELRDYWHSANPRPKMYLFPSKAAHRKDDVPMTNADQHAVAVYVLDLQLNQFFAPDAGGVENPR